MAKGVEVDSHCHIESWKGRAAVLQIQFLGAW